MSRLHPVLFGSICTLGLLCLLIGACRTDGPDTTAEPASADTAVATVPSNDTSTAMSDSVDRPDPPPPGPAPGTAHVRAEITSCDAASSPVRCQVRVEEVLGYGSATPPLSPGERTVGLASSLLADRSVAALDTLGVRTFVLKHAGDRPDLGDQSAEEPSPEWTILSIE
jgi:hypothetical protein